MAKLAEMTEGSSQSARWLKKISFLGGPIINMPVMAHQMPILTNYCFRLTVSQSSDTVTVSAISPDNIYQSDGTLQVKLKHP